MPVSSAGADHSEVYWCDYIFYQQPNLVIIRAPANAKIYCRPFSVH